MAERIYYEKKEWDELYELKKEADRLKETLNREKEDEKEFDRELKEVRTFVREAAPRLEEAPITKLQRLAPKVIGNLFDRVKFLEERIKEINETIETRKDLHKEMIAEINKDIEEKNLLAAKITDVESKRNIKLDISILRKEKRHENVQFWKDVVELRSELTELMEQHKTESKIADIFKSIGGKNDI